MVNARETALQAYVLFVNARPLLHSAFMVVAFAALDTA